MSSFPSRCLYLLRHAEADRPAGIADHDRPLSGRGQDQATAVGQLLAQEALPQLAIVSTALRTRTTWELVQKQLPDFVPVIYERSIYESHPRALLDVVRATPSDRLRLLVVGHNPGLHMLALFLVGQAQKNALSRLQHDFPPASLAAIQFDLADWQRVDDQAGVLARYVTQPD